jgi:hypothetical protein
MPGDLLAWPRNLITLAALIALSVLARFLRASKFFRFLTSLPFSVILICALALFALVMGLVPQLAPKVDLASVLVSGQDSAVARLGFLQVTSSWPFAVLYLLTLVALGATVAVGFGFRKRVFLLNHLGLWLILLAAGLGASDRQRELMRVPEGGLEWRASRGGELVELDLAIRLDDFIMEEYPARLALVNPATGKPWPSESAPAIFQIEAKTPRGHLGGYDIEVLKFLARAVPVGEEGFVGAVVNGAVQAALVKATDRGTGRSFEGWLTSGNGFVRPSSLLLGEGGPDRHHGLVLAMSPPEPKLFLSKVKVFTKDGHEAQASVSVNHPLRAGDWLIYQRDYDTSAGPLSSWSGFELIKDRWLWLAYAGFALWSMGCLGLTMGGRK